MSLSLSQLANPAIQNLSPYQPGKPISELERELGIRNVIKLASNENPLGPSPQAIAAAKQALADTARYPDGSGYQLKLRLSQYLNVDSSQLTLGNGSDDLLWKTVQAYVAPGHDVVMSQFAFVSYAIATRAHQANPIIVPATDWGHDLDAMAQAITPKTQLVFVANPNNPTGTWNTHAQLSEFLQAIRDDIIVLVDQAYYEYIDHPDYPNIATLQQQHPNLVATRTFSKAYGLAGMRVGYAISHPAIADMLNRIRLPFNVNSIALAAAQAALSDQAHIEKTRKLTRSGMQQYVKAFAGMPLPYIPSLGNFISVDIGQETSAIYQAMLHKGVIVRPLVPYGMPRHLRISIGLKEQNQRCLRALQEVLEL